MPSIPTRAIPLESLRLFVTRRKLSTKLMVSGSFLSGPASPAIFGSFRLWTAARATVQMQPVQEPLQREPHSPPPFLLPCAASRPQQPSRLLYRPRLRMPPGCLLSVQPHHSVF